MSIEEQQRAQRLILGRRRHVPFDGKRAEKLRDFRYAHLGRMALAVEEGEAADPST